MQIGLDVFALTHDNLSIISQLYLSSDYFASIKWGLELCMAFFGAEMWGLA